MFGMFKKGMKYHITRDGVRWYDPKEKRIRCVSASKDFDGYVRAVDSLKSGDNPKDFSIEAELTSLSGPMPESVVKSERLRGRWNEAATLEVETARGVRESLKKFHDRLQHNPSFRSREQLLSFMDHNDIPLQPNGKLLTFKAVRRDYFDYHTGESNEYLVGSVHTLDRSTVSDDPTSPCSAGLHVGGFQYVARFHRGESGRIVAVEVDPRDVVCVPNDSTFGKIRVCALEVTAEFKDVEEMKIASQYMLAFKKNNGSGDSLSDLIKLVGAVRNTQGNSSPFAKQAVVDFYLGDIREDLMTEKEYREIIALLRNRQKTNDKIADELESLAKEHDLEWELG